MTCINYTGLEKAENHLANMFPWLSIIERHTKRNSKTINPIWNAVILSCHCFPPHQYILAHEIPIGNVEANHA
jgi:hypothetical protein